MAGIRLEHIWKVYGDGTVAVRDLDLELADGEFVVLVGPSGCGKTTALRMVAGLEDVSSGTIRVGDRAVDGLHPRERDMAMVFQNYALYPHLSVADNIGFGLKLRGVDKAEIRRRVGRVAGLLGIEDLLERRPRALSGGQRQRVAMGRAIVREPAAFLMDEPLSNLDAKLRVQTRAEILRLQQELQVTTLYVTHDQVEAMTMGDRVAVMRRGVLQQVAAPDVLYDHPVNLFVAGFIGSPAMNLVTAALRPAADGGATIALGTSTLRLGAEQLAARPGLRALVGRDVVVGIRPEDMEDAALRRADADGTWLDVRADLVEKLGSDILVHFRLDAAPVTSAEAAELAEEAGARPAVSTADGVELVARVSPRSDVAVGRRARLRVDVGRAHFFDPETGLAVATPEQAEPARRPAPPDVADPATPPEGATP